MQTASTLLGRAKTAVRPCTRSSSRAVAPSSTHRPLRSRPVVLRVAAVENEQQTAAGVEEGATGLSSDGAAAASNEGAMKPAHLQPISAEELSELQLAELDGAQEQLLAWMMNVDEEAQEEELDEMVDYDEFGDEEYEELFEDVEELMNINEDNSQLKVADKVMGTVYELDDDGAYVEIGQKASGFVPLSECSFAKLKSVGVAAALGVLLSQAGVSGRGLWQGAATGSGPHNKPRQTHSASTGRAGSWQPQQQPAHVHAHHPQCSCVLPRFALLASQ